MSDQAALQEAIQRARQLAAKISQNAPAVKRPVSDLDDHHSTGTVKVTLAYEPKPDQQQNIKSPRSSSTTNNYNINNNNREIFKDSNHSQRDSRDRDRDDRDNDYNYPTGNSNGNSYARLNQQQQPSMLGGSGGGGGGGGGSSYGMLSGHNNYSPDEKLEIVIPHAVIGLVIGKGGENIKRIQNETGATVRVDPATVDAKGNKVCTIMGSKKAVDEAHNQVANIIENVATNKRPRLQMDGGDQYRLKIPASRTGAIIGKGGETIKSIKQQSGCDIELDKNAKDGSPEESVFIIRGTQEKISKAKALIEARLAAKGDRSSAPSSSHHNSSRGVATGANAAPVAQFTDLPTGYPVTGQPTSTDASAAWAAYYAQYSNLYNQAGAQPGSATNTISGSSYVGQNLLGNSGIQQPSINQQQPDPSIQAQAQPQTQTQTQQGQAAVGQQDYTDQWIEFYLMNGRPDYAEQIIETKRQQQAQKQQQQAQQNQQQ